MKVTLTSRWGQHKPGRTVDVRDTMGAWLVQRGVGVVAQPEQPAPAAEPTSTEATPTRRAYRRRAATTMPDQDATTSAQVDPTQVDDTEVAPKRRTRRKPSNADS